MDRRRAGALGLEGRGAFFCYGGYSAVDVEDRYDEFVGVYAAVTPN